MICRQCEESVNGTGCTKNGVCGKNAELADRQDVLVGVLMDISTTYGKGVDSESAPGIDALIVDGLFSTLTNTNFDIESINSYISEGEKLLSYIGGTRSEDFTIPSLDDNEDLRSLKELLLYGVKGLAAYYHHAYVLGGRDDSITDFIKKALGILRTPLTADELVALNMECGEVGVTCMALLDRFNTGAYGSPEITNVKTGVGNNPGILITGHDLKDLEMLLKQTEGKGIDVYTHGEMLPAHAYPEFKKYPHLVGNYGGAWYMQKEEFESFNGPIIATTNCVLLPRESTRTDSSPQVSQGYLVADTSMQMQMVARTSEMLSKWPRDVNLHP